VHKLLQESFVVNNYFMCRFYLCVSFLKYKFFSVIQDYSYVNDTITAFAYYDKNMID